MKRKIQALFQNLENSRLTILSMTEAYTDLQLNYKPGPNEWSMAQVMKHLLMTETQILHYIQRRIEQGNLHTSNYRSWLRYIVVVLALRYRKKIKAPKQVFSPPDKLNPTEVRQEWQQLRTQWKNALETMPQEMAEKDVFKHPLAGDMGISHTLGFMNEHVRHHMAQIRRIRQSANWK